MPPIIEPDTFDRAQRVSRENPKWNPRGAEPGAWLLRGLIECGHCQIGCNCPAVVVAVEGAAASAHLVGQRWASPPARRMSWLPERNIRADELGAYVFDQVRRALLEPAQLIAGERAVITSIPPDDDELIGAQLVGIERKLELVERERGRLLDAYQAALLDLDELARRIATLIARRDQLASKHATLTDRRAELARENRLRR